MCCFYRAKNLAHLENLLPDAVEPEQLSFFGGSKRFTGDYVVGATLDVIQVTEPAAFEILSAPGEGCSFPKLKLFLATVLKLSAFDGIRDMPVPDIALRYVE